MVALAKSGKRPPQALVSISASCEMIWIVFTQNIALSTLLTASRTVFTWPSIDFHAFISPSIDSNMSTRSLLCMWDHLNSGIRNGGSWRGAVKRRYSSFYIHFMFEKKLTLEKLLVSFFESSSAAWSDGDRTGVVWPSLRELLEELAATSVVPRCFS